MEQPLRLSNPVLQSDYSLGDMIREVQTLRDRQYKLIPLQTREEDWLEWAEEKLEKWSVN